MWPGDLPPTGKAEFVKVIMPETEGRKQKAGGSKQKGAGQWLAVKGEVKGQLTKGEA